MLGMTVEVINERCAKGVVMKIYAKMSVFG